MQHAPEPLRIVTIGVLLTTRIVRQSEFILSMNKNGIELSLGQKHQLPGGLDMVLTLPSSLVDTRDTREASRKCRVDSSQILTS